jgi:hypothetical protein
MLKESWNHQSSIMNNLQNIKHGITNWKLMHFDEVRQKKRELVARLGGIQRRLHNGNNSRGLRVLEYKLHHELNLILQMEELMWFQRSRAKWLTGGDRNTRYYHTKTVTRKNNIMLLRNEEGHWVEDALQIRSMVNDFYRNLFSLKHVSCDWIQTEVTYPLMEDTLLNKLKEAVYDEEVKRAGFPAGFFQKSWEIVGKNLCDFVRDVWRNPSHIASVNQTDICLIPKVPHPEFVNQFLPISLCNTIYKVVSKVIVERLKEFGLLIVSPFQTGFVPGRNIHENIVVALEMIHSMAKIMGKKGYFVIKVDLSKAYDKLKWGFIWRVLIEMRMPDNVINLIMHMVTSVETNIKWNGARADYFRIQRNSTRGSNIALFVCYVY